jgi:hypothetical protein
MSNINQDKNSQEHSEELDHQELICRYNLRKRRLSPTIEYTTQQLSDKTTYLPLIIGENTPVSIEGIFIADFA